MDEMVKVLIEKETIYAEEVDMLMNGATAEEVIAKMSIKEEQDKEKHHKLKVESEIQKLEESKNEKIISAEGLARVGILQASELERIKKEAEKKAEEEKEKLLQSLQANGEKADSQVNDEAKGEQNAEVEIVSDNKKEENDDNKNDDQLV